MRTALAVVMLIFTLGLVSRPMHGETREENKPALKTLRMIDGQTGWAVTATAGRLLRSSDGGANWNDVTPLNSSGQQFRISDKITALAPLVAWVIAAGTNDSTTSHILHTVDGGRTWESTIIRAPDVISISFINSSVGWLLAFMGAAAGSEAVEIYRSTDGGKTWISVGPVSGLPFAGDKSGIAFLNSTTGWITGAVLRHDTPYLFVTHDGGRTWREQDKPLPRELISHWRNLQHFPPKFFTVRDGVLPTFYEIYAGPGDSLRPTGKVFVAIYATHDGGTTWTYPSVKQVNDAYFSTFVDMNHGWLITGSDWSNLYATSDGGRQWTTIPRTSIFTNVVQVDFVSPQVGWALGRSLLKTLDGGRTWSPVTYSVLRK